MIRVNLIPTIEGAEQVPIQIYGALAAVVIGFAGLGFWYWSLTGDHAEKQQTLTELQQTRQTLQTVLDEIEAFRQEKESLETRINVIGDLRGNQKGPVELMNAVIDCIPNDPPGLWLSGVTQGGTGVSIDGRAYDVPYIADFIAALNAHPLFQFVELQFWTQDQPNSIRFQLNCQTVQGEEQ